MAESSTLVVVDPGDTIDTIIQKVRDTGSGRVELLVPDDTLALQALGGFARLRKVLEQDGVGALVISSDEKTLNAARLSQFETLGVEGTRVNFQPPSGNGSRTHGYATRALRNDSYEQPARKPIDEQDVAFLNALDQVPARDRYAELQDEDADIYAALDDLSDTIQQQSAAQRSADDEFAAALDELSGMAADAGATRRRPSTEDWDAAFGTSETVRPRVRPEDIEVSRDDMQRQRAGRRTEARRERYSGEVAAQRNARSTSRRARMLDLEEDDRVQPRRSPLTIWLPAVLLLLLIVVPVIWFLSSRATIAVLAPSQTIALVDFANEPIPISTSAQPSDTAVEATPVDVEAEFTVTGQVSSETLTPVNRARGTILIVNKVGQAQELPAQTQFVGKNAQGQEVRFVIDAPVTIPGAVTTTSLTGTSTSFGQATVSITALSPGSASNVDKDSITQIIIPGQAPLISDNSNFLIRHDPIGGGDEQPQRIVTPDDIQRALKEARTGLYNTGVQQLSSKIDPAQQDIDPLTITPSQAMLDDPNNYTMTLHPGESQPVDPNNPTFTLTLKARFSALATPRDRPIIKQLERVVPRHLETQNRLPPCEQEKLGFPVKADDLRWDGASLRINGSITCQQSQDDIVEKVKAAVRGKSREAAQAGLDALRQQGIIGGYQLPSKDSFPNLDFLLNVLVSEPQTVPIPTRGTN